MYRPKTDAEIKAKFDKQNQESIQRFKDKMKKDEPEDKADGGRIGFRAGKFVLDKIIAKLLGDPKKVKQAADDIFPTGDYKYDAQMAAEALVENNPRIFKNKLYDDLDLDTQIEIYGAVLEPIQKNMSIARQLKKASRPEKTLASMKEGKGIDMSDPNIADEFTRFMKETDPQGSKTIEQTVELANFNPKGRKKNATGGRAGFYTGGITDVEPSLDDIGHGSDSLMARTRLVSPGSQATTSTGLNYLLAEDNDNIRVPFKGGGLTPEDYLKVKDMLDHYHDYKKGGGTMSKKNFGIAFFRENNAEGGRIGFAGGGDPKRRAFLKLMATLGGGIAGLKSGMIGLGEGGAKKAVTETVKQSAGSGTPPPYFFKLVEKIKTMGDDVTPKYATKDREVVKQYKDFELTEDIATGEQTIQRIKTDTDFNYYDETLAEDVYMNYKPGKGQADEATPKVADEYVEDTSYIRTSGPQKGDVYDTVDGVPDDVIQEGTMFEDNMTEFGKTKKADGGRIGFRTGGSGKKFIEKIFGKGSLDVMKTRDPELHKGMLEVVEMFRNRDKEGLKIYLQKFLPHMDDETIEAFIVGDAADAAGQGKYGLDNIQGQLIRLGSGRDYAGKIKMVKDAENMRALDKLDVDKMKPNANGGLITMLGE